MDFGANRFSVGVNPRALIKLEPALSGSASKAGWMLASAALARSSSDRLVQSA